VAAHTATVDETFADQVVDLALPHRLVEQAWSPALDDAHDAVDRLIAWAEARRVQIVQALRAAGRSPLELVDLQSVHSTVAGVSRAERRADIATRFPLFAAAMQRGDVSAAHLDRLGEALRRLLPHEADLLAADQARLLLIAGAGSAGRFGRFLAREVARFERLRPAPEPQAGDAADDPAEARFAAQQAGIRLSSRLDRDTGMTIWRLALDPLRSLSLERRVAARVEALHHGPPIAGCPTDAFERQAFLRALALLQLVDHDMAGSGSPAGAEVIVVVDHTAPDGTPDVDWGRPVDIPQRVLDDLLGHPTTTRIDIVVRNGVVVSAPGQLDLGRTTRLANRAQRRALRALYRGCGVPGCDVSFDRCKIHHVQWWRHGGSTDLANLLPLCHRHHHLVHDRGWHLQLGPHRELTVTTPSGRVMATGPPQRWAA
jgi:hypothetical protein